MKGTAWTEFDLILLSFLRNRESWGNDIYRTYFGEYRKQGLSDTGTLRSEMSPRARQVQPSFLELDCSVVSMGEVLAWKEGRKAQGWHRLTS